MILYIFPLILTCDKYILLLIYFTRMDSSEQSRFEREASDVRCEESISSKTYQR